MELPNVHYLRTEDGVSIAYIKVGSGPVVVYAPGWISNLEVNWRNPNWGGIIRTLSEYYTVVRYDKRGCGLSDRAVEDLSVEAEIRDLAAVIEATAADPVGIWGQSDAGPPAIAYAATHPDRVAALILVGTQAAGAIARGGDRDPFVSVLETNWLVASRAFADRFMPSMDASRERIEELAAEQRTCSSLEVAHTFWQNRDTIDMRDQLLKVSAPTLVMHVRGDQVVPVEQGRELAAGIPSAQLFIVESENHIAVTPEERAPMIERAVEFFAEHLGKPAEPRVSHEDRDPASAGFRAILFTDVVASTPLLAQLKDARMREVMHDHDAVLQAAVDEHGGRVVKEIGDAFMAEFAVPSAAVECAIAMQRGIQAQFADSDVPIRLRIGINAGEPIVEDEDLHGASVVVAKRLESAAPENGILVSDVVKSAVLGKDFAFADKGEVVLKGFDEPVRTWSVEWA